MGSIADFIPLFRTRAARPKPSSPPEHLTRAGAHKRARDVWENVRRRFANPTRLRAIRDHLPYLERLGKWGHATVWPLSQAISARIRIEKATAHGRPGLPKELAMAAGYQRGDSFTPNWGGRKNDHRYYDDNAWIAQNFLDAYHLMGDRRHLEQAIRTFDFIVEQPGQAARFQELYGAKGYKPSGGLYWLEDADQMTVNTCTNGPALVIALELYEATKNPRYLQIAQRLDAVLEKHLRSPGGRKKPPEGMYGDHLHANGKVVWWLFSYNQGTPIGAAVRFYKLTGDKKYLERAQETARAALDYFAEEDRLWRQPPAFNAIFFRHLMELDEVAPNPRYRATLKALLERAWSEARDSRGLFTQGNVGSYQSKEPPTLLDQSAWAHMFALM